MKNFKLATFVLIVMCLSLQSCVQKTSSNKRTNSSSSGLNNNNNNNNDNNNGNTNDDDNNTTVVTGCSDGVARPGATRCYFKLPSLTFNGDGRSTSGHYWSSAYNLSSAFSQDNFRTDMTFSARIKPLIANSASSTQGRNCSQWTKANWDRLQVQLMLSKPSDNGLSNNIETFTAKVNQYSDTIRFNVPAGATGPLVLSVHSIMSNHRCNASVYGSLGSSALTTACNNGTAFFDIPVNGSGSNPTECIAFQIEFATDYTYDLP